MEKARYLEQVIPEYQGNPMIEALPEIWAGDTVEEMLSEEAPHHDGEDLCQHQWLPMVAVMADALRVQGKDLFYGSAFPNAAAGHPLPDRDTGHR